MSALLASVPLAVVLFGMGVLRLSAAIAGAIGLAIAVLLSATIFGAGAAPLGPARLLWGAFAEALH